MSRRKTYALGGPGSRAYCAMVRAIRVYLNEEHPDANLVDVTLYDVGGGGLATVAQFHFDPGPGVAHHEFPGGDGTPAKCPHCRGDRLAEGRGA